MPQVPVLLENRRGRRPVGEEGNHRRQPVAGRSRAGLPNCRTAVTAATKVTKQTVRKPPAARKGGESRANAGDRTGNKKGGATPSGIAAQRLAASGGPAPALDERLFSPRPALGSRQPAADSRTPPTSQSRFPIIGIITSGRPRVQADRRASRAGSQVRKTTYISCVHYILVPLDLVNRRTAQPLARVGRFEPVPANIH